MIQIPIADAPDQDFSLVLNDRRCTFRLRYGPFAKRWSFDLSIDDEPVLHGRRIVPGVELLSTFGFGLGNLFATIAPDDAEPDYDAFVSGRMRLYHASDADVAVLSA